jgi:predicted ATPase
MCRSIITLVLWSLGYPDKALEQSYAGLRLAQELSHPFSLALALSWTATAHELRGEWQAAQQQAEAAMRFCTEQGFSFWLAWGIVMQGWALAEQGQGKEGIAQIHDGLAALQSTGAKMYRPWLLTILAAMHEKAGQTEAELTTLTEAFSIVEKNGERFSEAERWRLKGELTLQRANHKAKGKNHKAKIETHLQPLTPSTQAEAEAEAYFLKAIEIARRQQAKTLELRVVMSLSRLWRKQGKKVEARQMLAGIYGWFTEGFDTKDLQEAQALLEELT